MNSIHKLLPRDVDTLVLGGGITGAGVARDLAMRGMRCLLVDSHDFASGTSHLTSKLIHGGLRYLEHAHIRPVIEGIVERDRLLHKLAPNLVWPLRFIMPFEARRFPKWLATVCSLQLYGLTDLIRDGRWSGGRLGPGLRRDYPQVRRFPMSISFWDAQTNDARLVMSTLRSAAEEGAVLCNYTTIVDAAHDQDGWTVRLRSESPEAEWTLRAGTIINATGPWSPLTAEMLGVEPKELMWIKGSHILLRRPAAFGDDAIVIRSVRDQRPLWAVPWQNRIIVGSTESRYSGKLRDARPTREEVDDLFRSFNHYFESLGVGRADIQCAFAGVRPIIAQETHSENSLSREHKISVDVKRHLITVNGGKLTTFRLMAEQAVDHVQRMLKHGDRSRELRRRLRSSSLWPNLTLDTIKPMIEEMHQRYGTLVPAPVYSHLVRLYGRDAASILDDIEDHPARGELLCEGPPYTLAEFAYLARYEHVCHLLDLVKRRTSLYFLGEESGFAKLSRIAETVAPILGWDGKRMVSEISAVAYEYGADMSSVEDARAEEPAGDDLTACA